MTDIKYKWKSNTAVGLDPNLILPQFKVVGHQQKERVIALSTGESMSEFISKYSGSNNGIHCKSIIFLFSLRVFISIIHAAVM